MSVYKFAAKLGLTEAQASQLGFNPHTYHIYTRLKPEDPTTEDKEIHEVTSALFGNMVKMLHTASERYRDNLDAKDDYSHYKCYVSDDLVTGFCVNQDTNEFCNFFSISAGRGKEVLEYALQNYNCYGLANALAETYRQYYAPRFDVVTHHWEENWDYPGDKSQAVWFGYLLPKGTLSEEDRVDMMKTAVLAQEKALSKEDVENLTLTVSEGETSDKFELAQLQNDILNEKCCVLSSAQKDVLKNALKKCLGVVRDNQMENAWKIQTFNPLEVRQQMDTLWQTYGRASIA